MTTAHDSDRLAGLGTEAVRPELRDLDQRPTSELVRLALDEHHAVDAALESAAPAIVAAVDAVASRMRRGGRLVYLGAGTPGRLGALDAAERPPTYATAPGLVVAVVAGGAVGVARSTEQSEDEGRAAVAARPEFRFRASHRPAAGGEREVAPLLMGRVGAVGRACREARRPAD